LEGWTIGLVLSPNPLYNGVRQTGTGGAALHTKGNSSRSHEHGEAKRVESLLRDLPPESILLLEQFADFLREQARQGQPVGFVSGTERTPFRYPTVSLSASKLKELTGILPDVGGDALADTEALYDEV
jgi:hypothetical protein